MIRIEKVSNVWIRVIAPDSVRMGLNEHFTKYAPNYQFNPKFKAKVWDGKIRLFKYGTGMIYAGLLLDVVTYLKLEGYQFQIDSDVKKMFQNPVDVSDWLKEQRLSAYGEPLTPHDYQEEAFRVGINLKRAIFKSPTSSGKSLIIYLLFKYLIEEELREDKKVLIIVPNLGLISQMKNDFLDYSSLNGMDIEGLVGLHNGNKKELGKKVIVSTWQSIFKLPLAWFEAFDAVLVDEVHQATANSLVSIMEKSNAKFRFGLTGSFEDNELTSLTLRGLYGPLKTTTTTKELQERNIVSKLNIECHVIQHDKTGLPKKLKYDDEIDFILQNQARNKYLIDIANDLPGNSLILFNLVEKHGKPLFKMAKEISKKEVFFVYGGVDVDEREKIRQILETHKGAIVIASYKTFSTGISVRNLHNIILGSPTKSFTRIVQSIGRGLRKSSTKLLCRLIDVADYICGDKEDNFNHGMKHFLVRLKIYNQEQHEYTTKKVTLK